MLQSERRDKSFKGRAARMSYPILKSVDAALDAWPCSVLGHKWKEVPPSLRSQRARGSGKLEFRCERCSRAGGFSN